MAVNTIGNLTLDELIASGKNPLHTRVYTIKGSTALKRGQLIGKTTTGSTGSEVTTYAAYASGATVVGILCEDVTPTTAGVDCMVYVSGHFNGNKVTGYTASIDEECRKLGIFIDKAMTY